MLAQLTISNFAIVRELEIDFHSGMTVITGETGAGKSIAIDALGLCLGGRAEADMVRTGAARADLCARFSLKDTPAALRWLEENQLEDGHECLLRRVQRWSLPWFHQRYSCSSVTTARTGSVADSDPWSARSSVTHQTRAPKVPA